MPTAGSVPVQGPRAICGNPPFRSFDVKRIFRLTILGSAIAMAMAGPSFAHAKLVQSVPAANATVTAPSAITLAFNERVIPTFSKAELTMPGHGGMKVPVTISFSADGKRLIATPRSKLMKGAYKLAWSAAGPDGHRMTGEFAFEVS
jgi:copper resistance protein C